MKSIFDLCVPRDSVFNGRTGDDVLDLTNLLDNSINAEKFFAETYMTDGMKELIEKAFTRFSGNLDRGMLRLSQAMGGGKTHCLIALGLLAKNKELRHKICDGKYDSIGDINIVAFSGRETDVSGGIWGEIARQLGKEDFLSNYYNPPKAPGQTTWENLLENDKPTLILLDEIPYYLDAMRNYASAEGTLADITTTALTNLFNAVARLNNVLIVLSELSGSYERGGRYIESAYHDLDRESGRFARSIDPVGRQNDDLYNILKKKCFSIVPEASSPMVEEVAAGYRTARTQAKQMGATLADAESIYTGILASYPFHPSLKDIFGRFRGNANFQQTRGCIRLVRDMVRCLWENHINGNVSEQYLINAYDINLRDSETYNTVRDIKPVLADAISHDIVAQGGTPAMAEECDAITGTRATEAVAKMLLMSSLSTIPGGLVGLGKSDIAAFMVSPVFSVGNLSDVLSAYRAKAWYLYEENDKFFFKETKNIRADLEDRRRAYTTENSKSYIKKELERMFAPQMKDVYQRVLVFPDTTAELEKLNVSLIIAEPNTTGVGIRKDLKNWYDNQSYKNRACFLTGARHDMGELYDIAAQNLAINSILDSSDLQNLPESDPQKKEAKDLKISKYKDFKTALKEIFVDLYYPFRGLKNVTIDLKFDDNNFNAEDQIRNTLKAEHKFETVNSANTTEDNNFRIKIESRLFTAQRMMWSDIETRAADNDSWCWCKPETLREAKNRYIMRGFWAENASGMLDKNPPKPKTVVQVREIMRNGSEVTLRLTPTYGDTIRYEIGQEADPLTAALVNVSDFQAFHTSENKLYFVCVDSTGEHEVGEQVVWENKCKCRYCLKDQNDKKIAELETDGENVEIHYTTDGSDPRSRASAIYHDYIELPRGNVLLQAVTYCTRYDVWGEILQTHIDNSQSVPAATGFEIDDAKPVVVNKTFSASGRDAFDLLHKLEACGAEVDKIYINITFGEKYTTYECGGNYVSATDVSQNITKIMEFFESGSAVSTELTVGLAKFPTGRRFKDWVSDMRKELAEFRGSISQ